MTETYADRIDSLQQEWPKGTKIAYPTIANGTILGVVTGAEHDYFGDYVVWRVTTRNVPTYRCGLVMRTLPSAIHKR